MTERLIFAIIVPMLLTLWGPVPAKKNRWRRRRGGGIGLDRQAQNEIDNLITQARIGWGGRAPVESPVIAVLFGVSNRRADPDNKFTTILDVLVSAGVLVDDSFMRCDGMKIIFPCRKVKKGEEFTGVEIC